MRSNVLWNSSEKWNEWQCNVNCEATYNEMSSEKLNEWQSNVKWEAMYYEMSTEKWN